MASGREAQNMKPLDQVLDEKINIKDIGLVQNSYMYDRDGALISENRFRSPKPGIRPL